MSCDLFSFPRDSGCKYSKLFLAINDNFQGLTPWREMGGEVGFKAWVKEALVAGFVLEQVCLRFPAFWSESRGCNPLSGKDATVWLEQVNPLSGVSSK